MQRSVQNMRPAPRRRPAKVKQSLSENTGCNLKSKREEKERSAMCFKSKESRAEQRAARPPACVFFLSRLGRGAGVAFHRWPGRPTAVCPDRTHADTHLGQVALRHGSRVSRAAAAPPQDAPVVAIAPTEAAAHCTHTLRTRTHSLALVIHSPPLALDYLRLRKTL